MDRKVLRKIIKEEYDMFLSNNIVSENIDTDFVAHAARTATFPIRPTSKAEQFQKEIVAGGPYNKISDVIAKIKSVLGNNSHPMIKKSIESAEQVLKYRTGLTESSLEEDLGAFRRMVITSPKHQEIQKEFESLMHILNDRGEFNEVKIAYKKGANAGTIVVDINGTGATALANKFKPLVGKIDKSAILKIKNTITTVPAASKVNEEVTKYPKKIEWTFKNRAGATIKKILTRSGRKDTDGTPIYWDITQNPTKFDYWYVSEIDWKAAKVLEEDIKWFPGMKHTENPFDKSKTESDRLTVHQLKSLKPGTKVVYIGKGTLHFKSGETYEVSRVEVNGTFQPTVTIKGGGRKLNTRNLALPKS